MMHGNNNIWLGLGLALRLVSMAVEAVEAAEPVDLPRVRGQVLAHDLVTRRPEAPIRFEGTFLIRPHKGSTVERALTCSILLDEPDSGWRTVYRMQPEGEVLTLYHLPRGEIRYRWEGVGSGAQAVAARPFVGAEAMRSFGGSDFWVADLALEFLHWPNQTIIGKEMRKGRRCHVLESRPDGEREEGYGRVVSWVDAETGGLLMAEAFGTDGERWKEFNIRSFQKVNGRWQVKAMEIRDTRKKSRTILEMDFE